MLIEMDGDIFENESGIIVHGCNSYGVMGAGVAKVVHDKFPFAYQKYKEVCEREYVNREFLGGGVVFAPINGQLTIANAITQINPGPDARPDLIRQSLRRVMIHARLHNQSVHSVKIGCGIGGLDWDSDVRPIYEDLAREFSDVNLIVWKG